VALTRAQLLAGNQSQGVVLPGQVQAVTAGPGVDIDSQGVLSLDGSDPSFNGFIKTNNAFAYNAYVWPGVDGTAGEFLQTDGAGNLTWAAASGFAVVTVQSGAPSPADVGELWFDCATGTLNVYQNCVGTPSPNWFNVAQPGLPVLPANTIAAPPFTGGNGTLATPYDCTVTTAAAGSSVFVVNTVTITGLAPFQFVPIVDLNAVTNGGRFTFSNNYADISGNLVFQTIFKDQPASPPATSYTAAIKVGYGSVYIDAIVNVVTPVTVTGGTITGPSYENQQLTYTPGVPSGGSTPYAPLAYQWFADGITIPGAAGLTYTVTAAEIGAIITATTTVTDAGGGTATGTSNSIGPILADPGPLTVTSPGSIAPATAVATTVLNYTTGTYSGGIPTVTASWVWQKAGVDIAGTANATSYTVVAGDVGSAITVKYTVTDSATPTAATAFASTTGVTPTAPIPTTDWNPGNGMNTSVPGTSSATWNGATGLVTSTGCVVISLDGSSWTQSLTATNGQPLYVQWDMSNPTTCGNAPSGTTIQGTVVNGSLINSYSIQIVRIPAAFGFGAGSTTAALNSVQTWTPAATISGTNAAGYVTVASFTGGGSNFEASINGGGFAAVPTAPSTAMPILPGQTITVRYTTDGTTSASFSGSVKIGDSDGVAGTTSSPAFTVTNTSSAAFPGVTFANGGPNSAPETVLNVTGGGTLGTLNGTSDSNSWPAAYATTLSSPTSGGNPTMKMQVNGAGGFATSGVSIASGQTLNLAWNEAYLTTVADTATATGTITGTVGAATYTNTFTMTVKRSASWTAPTTVNNVALTTAVNSGLLTVDNFNVPVTVSFANPSGASGATAMTAVSVAVNGVSTPVTLGTTTVTLNPGDTFQLFGTTGGTNSTKYGYSVTIGTATAQDWYVETTAVTPSIQTPAIQTPANNATNVGTASGITVSGDTYTPLNGAGAQTSSTWELYSGSYPLESANVVTNVVTNPSGSWTPTFTPLPGGYTNYYGANVFNGKFYIGVSNNSTGNQVFSSPDGVAWTAVAGSVASGGPPWCISVTNGKMFVSAGSTNAPAGGATLLVSSDGVNFSETYTPGGSASLNSPVVYANGEYLVFDPYGQAFSSTTGTGTWTDVTSAMTPAASMGYNRELFYTGTAWLRTKGDAPLATYRSTDGRAWTSVGTAVTGICQGPTGTLVASSLSSTGTLAYSLDDGQTWTTVPVASTGYCSHIVYAGGLFVAPFSSDGKVFTSPDGITWTLNSTQTNITTSFGPMAALGNTVISGNNANLFVNSSIAPTVDLTIANCQTEGFLVGDTVVSNPAGGGPATILSLDNTQVTVTSSTGWLGNSTQKLARATSMYTAVTGSPFTVSTGTLTSLAIAKPPLAANTKYWARVRYSTTTPSAIDSDYSPWSGFTTGSLVADTYTLLGTDAPGFAYALVYTSSGPYFWGSGGTGSVRESANLTSWSNSAGWTAAAGSNPITAAVTLSGGTFARAASPNGALFKTTNNGTSWSNVGIPAAAFAENIVGNGASRAITGGGTSGTPAAIYYTSDGGVTWNASPFQPFAVSTMKTAWGSGGNVICQSGNATYRRSTDGGATWSADITFPVPFNTGAFGVNMAGNASVMVLINQNYQTTTSNNKLAYSTDQGLTWTVINTPSVQTSAAGAYTQFLTYQGTIYLVDILQFSNTLSIKTSTDGVNWSAANTITNASVGTGSGISQYTPNLDYTNGVFVFNGNGAGGTGYNAFYQMS
jgi:hypothetical protein